MPYHWMLFKLMLLLNRKMTVDLVNNIGVQCTVAANSEPG